MTAEDQQLSQVELELEAHEKAELKKMMDRMVYIERDPVNNQSTKCQMCGKDVLRIEYRLWSGEGLEAKQFYHPACLERTHAFQIHVHFAPDERLDTASASLLIEWIDQRWDRIKPGCRQAGLSGRSPDAAKKILGPALPLGLSDTLNMINRDDVEKTDKLKAKLLKETLYLENARKNLKCPTCRTDIIPLQRCIKKSTKYYHITCAETKFPKEMANIVPVVDRLDYEAQELWEAWKEQVISTDIAQHCTRPSGKRKHEAVANGKETTASSSSSSSSSLHAHLTQPNARALTTPLTGSAAEAAWHFFTPKVDEVIVGGEYPVVDLRNLPRKLSAAMAVLDKRLLSR